MSKNLNTAIQKVQTAVMRRDSEDSQHKQIIAIRDALVAVAKDIENIEGQIAKLAQKSRVV